MKAKILEHLQRQPVHGRSELAEAIRDTVAEDAGSEEPFA